MTPQEERALATLREELNRERQAAFSYLRELDRMTAEQLAQVGYRGKTNAEAMQLAFRHYAKEIEQLIQKHERLYP